MGRPRPEWFDILLNIKDKELTKKEIAEITGKHRNTIATCLKNIGVNGHQAFTEGSHRPETFYNIAEIKQKIREDEQ